MVFRGGSPRHDQSRLPPTPVGVPEGSRGSSAANTPGPRPQQRLHPEGGARKRGSTQPTLAINHPPESPPHTAPNGSAQRANNPFSQPAGPRFPRSPQPRPIANPRAHAPHSGCRVPVGPGDRRCRFAQPPANFCDPYRGRRSATSSPGTPNDRLVSR